MSPVAKGCTSTIIIVALGIAGFTLGLRSCLARFDERSALPPVLYFTNDSSSVLFSLIKYTKVNSYSNTGGLTRKIVTHYYYIQCNDATSGKKIKSREISSDIKNFPEKVLGAEGTHAWAFINELMAFDAFSLEQIADIKTIEAKNPSLVGMMPKESQYYEFNDAAKGIVFKTNDGSQWIIHSNTLIAKPFVEALPTDNKTIAERVAAQLQERLKNLQKPGVDFNQIKVNQDTINHQWLGLYASQEIETLYRKVSLMPCPGQDTRRQFYTAVYDAVPNRGFEFDTPALQPSTASSYYLNGGFLADKQIGKPIRLNDPAGYLLIHKKVIGLEGDILLSRISKDGKTVWELNTGVNKWVDYKLAGNSLFIFANDNKEVSSGECSILLTLDCRTGKVNTYDYFKDVIRQ
ncbi:MAG: PA2928 family protein [Chitinophagaceae bacterium]